MKKQRDLLVLKTLQNLTFKRQYRKQWINVQKELKSLLSKEDLED